MKSLVLVAFLLGASGLTACSGGGNSSESSSSSSSASSSSTSSSSSSSSSTSGSGGTGETIPNATSNGHPYCRSADFDPDGDGWGWENGDSCIVFQSSVDPGPGDYDYCIVGQSELPFCTNDTNSWGVEDNALCLARNLCPGVATKTQSAMREDLVNENASSTANGVYDYLRSTWGNAILSGQQDLTWDNDIDMAERVFNDTGKYPAIMGYDFMNYTQGMGDGQNQTGEALSWWSDGGLVSFCWHWRDPEDNDDGFYSDQTDFTIPLENTNFELDTSSSAFLGIQEDVDLIASELQALEDAGVTVLWRPLHEASGGWFWWGRYQRSDDLPAAWAQIVLWRYLYERLTNHHGLDNLIWIWNGQSAIWYPGDDYVDIVSYDIYDGEQNYESQIAIYKLTKDFAFEEKLVALSENSNIPDPDNIEATGAWWLYFMVWNDSNTAEGVDKDNNFWTGEYYNTGAHKSHVYNHELVLTLDELPEF